MDNLLIFYKTSFSYSISCSRFNDMEILAVFLTCS